MILSIADFFIRRPVFATVCSIIVTLVGATCIFILPIAQYPEIVPPQVNVVSNYTGADALTVETTVTTILERELNGIEAAKYITSSSSNDGTSNISVTFNLGRNQDLAAVDVQNRVSSVLSQLPPEVQQTGVRVRKQSTGFLLAIGVYSDKDENGKLKYDNIYLSNYADLYITDVIKRAKGVSDVTIFGERKYAMRLWLDPNRLAARKLTAQDVATALQQQNLQVGAGQIGQQPAPADQAYQLSILAQGRLKEANEFEDIVIKTFDDGSLIRVRDIGRAELGAENYGTVLRFNGIQGVGLGVSQLPDANALDVAHAVKKEMEELSLSFPPGLHYQVAYDTTLFVEAGAEEVIVSLFLSVGLVVVIIFLFLQNWRATLIPALAIPVALIGTFIFVKLLNFNINTLTLFGLTLATGLVVDDAIVVVEDITRRIQDDGMNPIAAAIKSMNELLSAVIASSLVLIAVFIPVAFFPGTTGQLYKQFALTIAFSITVSTFNAITFTPMLSAQLLRRGQVPNNWFFNGINWVIDNTRSNYDWAVRKVTHLKGVVLVLFVVGLFLTYIANSTIPTGFLPEEDQGYFITIVQAPDGVSINYTEKILEQVEAIVQTEPSVQDIFAIGGFSFSGNTPNNGIIFTTLKPWGERKSADQSAAGIMARLRPQFRAIKEGFVIPFPPPAIQGIGSTGGFQYQLQDKNNQDFRVLEQTMGQLLARASTYPDPQQQPKIVGVRPSFNGNTPQLSVEVDREKANALQISPQDIFSTLQAFLGSRYVNDFNAFGRSYRVYIQADQQFRSNPEDISRLYVRSRTGQMISMGNLIKVTPIIAPSIINHFNLFRSIEITGNPAPGVSSGEAIGIMEKLSKELPRSFSHEWSGLSLEERSSGAAALVIFSLGIVMVFLVMAAQYENYIDPLIIMLTVPLAILGALLAIKLRNFSNDVYTQIGFVMLIGMASKNAILIVEFANQLREKGASITQAVVAASGERLRPILMTALSTIIGAFPLAIASGAGAASRQSLGTTIIGGMIVATVLSLFVVPVLYITIKTIEDRFKRGLYTPQPALVGDGGEVNAEVNPNINLNGESHPESEENSDRKALRSSQESDLDRDNNDPSEDLDVPPKQERGKDD
ncbi:MAG: hydrophobe/amphiphile efflux-1 family RND transporter [Pseudanabaena sp.]|nr:MAG: hydrophobe/amphiphile efflux-1 family RND transporter [Pseudanabaena sp.]